MFAHTYIYTFPISTYTENSMCMSTCIYMCTCIFVPLHVFTSTNPIHRHTNLTQRSVFLMWFQVSQINLRITCWQGKLDCTSNFIALRATLVEKLSALRAWWPWWPWCFGIRMAIAPAFAYPIWEPLGCSKLFAPGVRPEVRRNLERRLAALYFGT